jgi:hypothetical protein
MISRNSSRIAALILMLTAGTARAQKAPDEKPASLAGTVVNSVTGEPIAKVHVSIQATTNGNQVNRGAVTDSQGKFSLSPLPAGRYIPMAERTGFVMLRDSVGLRTASVQLRAGESKDDFTIKLAPGGTISGRVVDADGEPVESVWVTVEGLTGTFRRAQTDDEGQFRLGGLAPGRYRLLASSPELQLPPEIRTDGTVETNNAATYYPSSLTRRGAGRIEVKPGGEVSGVEVRMVRTPVVGVSGTVSGLPKGTRTAVQVRSLEVGSGTGTTVKPDGTFAVWRLSPGKYVFSVSIQGGAAPRMAEAEVEVASSNIEHVDLAIAEPIEISGRVDFEEANTLPASSRNIMAISLAGTVPAVQIHPAADGSFTVGKVTPARYRLQYLGTGYVKSARLGGVETPGGIVDLRNAGAGSTLTVVVATGTGSLSGKVSDDGAGLNGWKVALVPDTPGGAVLARFSEIQPDGSYSLPSLPPGEYKLALIDDLDESIIRDGAGLDDYKDAAVSVTVRPREKTQQDLSRGKR